MNDRPCLLTIHAHPDDEASKGAPTMARYKAQGVHTVLVCCTGGEEGDLHNPALREPGQQPEQGQRQLLFLAQVRPQYTVQLDRGGAGSAASVCDGGQARLNRPVRSFDGAWNRERGRSGPCRWLLRLNLRSDCGRPE